jgi:hypothetical protein
MSNDAMTLVEKRADRIARREELADAGQQVADAQAELVAAKQAIREAEERERREREERLGIPRLRG